MKKITMSFIMFDQVMQNYEQAVEAQSKNLVDNEIKNCMSSILLLGIVLEGIVNELAYNTLDSWTYNHFDRSTPQFKWKIISDNIDLQLVPGTKPLEIIDNVFKIRNKVAHLKPATIENDVILTTQNLIIKNPEKNYILPDEDINMYLGYGKLHDEFNTKNLKTYIKEIYSFLKKIKDNNVNVYLDWIEQYKDDMHKL